MEGRLVVLALIVAGLFGPSAASGATLPKPTYTNKTRFRIPFKFDSAALKRMNAREVQLHVSQNQGDTWDLAQVLTPDGGKFEYVAQTEGEYWFAVKTLDGQNQLRPPRGSYETGLIVIVDTTNPVFDLSLSQIDVGKVQARWRASDTHLEIDTMRLEYLVPGSKDWALLDVAPRARGETSWVIKHTGIVSVRGIISDTAGNVANTKVQLEVDAENYPALKQRPVPQGKIAKNPAEEDNVGRAKVESSLSALPIPEPDDEDADLRTNGRRTASSPQSSDKYAMRQPQSRYDAGRSAIPATTVSKGTRTATPDVDESTGESLNELSDKSGDASSWDQSEGSHHKVVSSRRLQIGYKIDDVGPSGVGAVELFITNDNGRKWTKYGTDPDLKSPFDVEVPSDGEFGFAIRVRSGAGLSIDPPAAGERPSMVVAVDQTPPVVELLKIQPGEGTNGRRISIQWRATEDHPAEKSVSLYYAASRSGPWELISGWREDQGSEYEWSAGSKVPDQFYIRVLIRDAAGNVGKAETPRPVVVDLARPTAQLLDVETAIESEPR